MTQTLETTIESVLYWKAEPVSKKELGKMLGADEESVSAALQNLKTSLKGRGVILIEKDEEVEIRTTAESSTVIEKLQREELTKDLGKAGLETLAIILYEGPIGRRELDYIRGVNSSFVLRNLQIRGLIDRIANPDDQRSFLYRPTFDLLGHLGISAVTELPEYEAVRKEIEVFKKQSAGPAEAERPTPEV